MNGSDKKQNNLLVIGKFKTPRCFKNVKNFTLDYRSNKKAWITGEIVSNWLIKNRIKDGQGKTAYPIDCRILSGSSFFTKSLDFMMLVFLPPNTTFVLQHMDQSIIEALKIKFRKQLVFKIINLEERGK